jgi:predicted DNA-binding transcriptional regulator AlpA
MPTEAILPLVRPQVSRDATEQPSLPPVTPEQVPAALISVVAGVGESTWWRLHSAGKVPRPNKLGGKTLWRVQEIRDWIAAGCPDRRTWEAIRNARK